MKSPKYAQALLAACQQWMTTSTLVDPKADLNAVANAARAMEASADLPKIVCLCGSTRFREAFEQAQLNETMSGRIVLTVGGFPYASMGGSPEHVFGESAKAALDDLHKRKIDLCDSVLVLNVDGYIGSSTRSEVDYALATGKLVRWLEPERIPLGYAEGMSTSSKAYAAGGPVFNELSDEEARAQASELLRTHRDGEAIALAYDDRVVVISEHFCAQCNCVQGTVKAVIARTKGEGIDKEPKVFVVELGNGDMMTAPAQPLVNVTGVHPKVVALLQAAMRDYSTQHAFAKVLANALGVELLGVIPVSDLPRAAGTAH